MWSAPLVIAEDPDLVEALEMLTQLPKPTRGRSPNAKVVKASATSSVLAGANGASAKDINIGFDKASSHREFKVALTRMCAAMVSRTTSETQNKLSSNGLSQGTTVLGD